MTLSAKDIVAREVHSKSCAEPEGGIRECITKDSRVERDRCIKLIWENRSKCTSYGAALALMDLLNGNT